MARLEAVLGSVSRGEVNTGKGRSHGIESSGAACLESRWSDQSKEQDFALFPLLISLSG